MWEIVSKEVWKTKLANSQLPVFYQPDFVDSVIHAFKVDALYYIYSVKANDKAYYVCYHKNRKVYNPEPFSFTPLYINPNLSEPVFLEIVETLVQALKERFKSISFKLDLRFEDIRPFKWNGFDIDVRYTRVKTDFTSIHPQVYKNLKKIDADKYHVQVQDSSEEGLELILDFQKKVGVLKDFVDYRLLFGEFQKRNLVKFFEVYDKKSNNLICSRVVLLDVLCSKMYLMIISDVRSEDKNIHTYLNDIVINWAKENGIAEIDFCGANVKSISIFKSFFGTELRSYYVVSYSHWSYKVAVLLKSIWRKMFKKKN